MPFLLDGSNSKKGFNGCLMASSGCGVEAPNASRSSAACVFGIRTCTPDVAPTEQRRGGQEHTQGITLA